MVNVGSYYVINEEGRISKGIKRVASVPFGIGGAAVGAITGTAAGAGMGALVGGASGYGIGRKRFNHKKHPYLSATAGAIGSVPGTIVGTGLGAGIGLIGGTAAGWKTGRDSLYKDIDSTGIRKELTHVSDIKGTNKIRKSVAKDMKKLHKDIGKMKFKFR